MCHERLTGLVSNDYVHIELKWMETNLICLYGPLYPSVCVCAAPVCGGGTVYLISCVLAQSPCGRQQNAFGVSTRATISPGLSCWCRPNRAGQSGCVRFKTRGGFICHLNTPTLLLLNLEGDMLSVHSPNL